MLRDIEVVSSFQNSHAALLILHDCLSFGPLVYFARLVEPSPEVVAVYSEVDQAVRRAFARLTCIEPTEKKRKKKTLPLSRCPSLPPPFR